MPGRRWIGRRIAREAGRGTGAISQVASVLVRIDPDLAIDAIDEVDEPQARKAAVSRLLVHLESEQEALRVGRRYDFDRDAVLALREGARPHLDAVGTVGFISLDGLPLSP